WDAAVKYLQKAVDLKPSYDRLHQRLSQAVGQKKRLFGDKYISLLNDTDNGNWRIKDSKNNSRKSALFIDCGGYDGCSAIKFLMSHLNYDCVSFEPNPDLWDYYTDIPTKLIKKAVFTYDGTIEFTVDPVDADGSSLLPDKKIDFYGKVSNENCPVITVDCIDLSAFISQVSQIYPKIILKLDVEGAEYDILEKMVQERTVRHIDQLYCEFHGHKVNVPKERHDQLISTLQKSIKIEEWDGQDMAIHTKAIAHKRIRENVLTSVKVNRKLLNLD
ncbi:FkbM family methyltransferase, partial [Arthrospira platensis SPKY2]